MQRSHRKSAKRGNALLHNALMMKLKRSEPVVDLIGTVVSTLRMVVVVFFGSLECSSTSET